MASATFTEHRKIKRRPNELRIEMKIKPVLETVALLHPNIDVGTDGYSKMLFDPLQHSAVMGTRAASLGQIPEPVIDVQIRPLLESAFRVLKDSFQIGTRIPIPEIVMKAMKREIDLAESRVEKELGLLFAKQNTVGDKENPNPMFATNRDEVR